MGESQVALPFTNYTACHFGAIYTDGMTGDPPFYIEYSNINTWQWKAFPSFDEILSGIFKMNLSFRCYCHLVEYPSIISP